MALIESVAGNTSTSDAGIIVPADIRVANPFVPANLTLVEAIASTAEAWAGFKIETSGVVQPGIIVVTTGAAGSEVRIAALPAKIHMLAFRGISLYVPIPVAAGTRIAIGHSAATTSTAKVSLAGIPAVNFAVTPGFTMMDSGPYHLDDPGYGAPVTVDPGGTAHTKGSWTEISKTTGNGPNNVLNGDSLDQAYAHFGFLLGDNFEAAQADHGRLWDIGTGAAASELAYLAGWPQSISQNEISNSLAPFMHPWDKPTTTRIAARMQASITDVDDRVGSILLFGVR